MTTLRGNPEFKGDKVIIGILGYFQIAGKNDLPRG